MRMTLAEIEKKISQAKAEQTKREASSSDRPALREARKRVKRLQRKRRREVISAGRGVKTEAAKESAAGPSAGETKAS